MSSFFQSDFQNNNAVTPVRSAKDIRAKLDNSYNKNYISNCVLSSNIESTETVTIPTGYTLNLDLAGFSCNLQFNVVGILNIDNGILNNYLSGAGAITATNVAFTGSSVATGNISNSSFVNCEYPTTFTDGYITHTVISGKMSSVEVELIVGSAANTPVAIKVDLAGGLNCFDPYDSNISLTGDYTNTSNLGTQTNILARNVSNIPSIPSITADGYAVLGRTGSTSGTPVSIAANVGEVLIRDASTGLDFRPLAVSDISGLSTTLNNSQRIPTKITTTDLTIDPAIYPDGYLFSNKGATTLITITLPGAQEGRNYRFLVDGYTGMRLQATTGDNIVCGRVSTDDDGYIVSYNPTDVLHLYCQDSETWFDLSNANLPVNSVTDTILRDSAGLSVIGKRLSGTGDPADIIAGTDGYILYRDSVGPELKFGTPPISSIANLQTTLNTKVDKFVGTDNALVRSDGTGGAQQNSVVIVSDIGEISGLRDTITTYTGAATLSISQSGTWIDNRGATSLVPITLPAPQSGLVFGFYVEENDGLQVKVADSSGYYLELDGYLCVGSITSYDVGDAIILQGVGTEGWRGISSTGKNKLSEGKIFIGDGYSFAREQTLSGDASISSTGVLTISNDAVTFAKMQNSAAGLAVVGRPTNSAGDFSEIVASSDGTYLRRNGNNLEFGAVPPMAGSTLTANKMLWGNASNVATEIAVDGDLYQDPADGFIYISGGAVDLSKISSSGATTDQVIQFDGVAINWATLPSVITDHTGLTSVGTLTHDQLETELSNKADISDLDGYQSKYSAAGLSVLGKPDSGAGVFSEIVAADDGYVLKYTGGEIKFAPHNSGVTDHTLLTNIGTNSHTTIDSHLASTSNPHNVTKSQILTGNLIVNADIEVGADIALTKLDTVTANMALVSDADGYITAHGTVSSTELGYLDGATSNIQTQINGKVNIADLDGYTLKASSSTDNALVKFDGTTGRNIQNSGIIISDNNEMTGQRRLVSDKTANYTITSSESGTLFTNRGASSRPKFTLPTMAAGQIFSFLSYESVGLEIEPASGNAISYDGYTTNIYTGGTLILSGINDALTLVGQNDGYMFLATDFVADEYISNSNIIAGAGINLSKLESIAGLSVICNPTSSTATPTVITAGTDGYVLKRSGSTLVFAPDSTGAGGVSDGTYTDIQVSGSGTSWNIVANAVGTTEIADANVTLAKIQNISSGVLLGRDSIGSGVTQQITPAAPLEFTGSSGFRIATGGITATHIADGTITDAEISQHALIDLSKFERLTANRALVSDVDGYITAHSTVSDTELGYLDGATSNIQTQLNNKANTSDLDGYLVNTAIANSVIGRASATSGLLAPIQATVANTFLKFDGVDVVWSSTGVGTGDLVGPASSTNHALTRFDGTTGKLVKNSTVTLDNSGYISGMASITGKLNTDFYITTDGTGTHKFYRNSFKRWEINDVGSLVGDDVTYSIVPRILGGSNSSSDVIYGCVADPDTGIGFGGGSTNSIKFITGGSNPFEITENAFVGNDGYTYTPMVIGGTNSSITPLFTSFDDTTVGIGIETGILNLITNSTKTFTINQYNLRGNPTVSEQTGPHIRARSGSDGQPIYSFDGYSDTGFTLKENNFNDEVGFISGGSPVIWASATRGGLVGDFDAAYTHVPLIRSGSSASSSPIYSFNGQSDSGLNCDSSGNINLIRDTVEQIKLTSDNRTLLNVPTKVNYDTRTTRGSDLTVDGNYSSAAQIRISSTSTGNVSNNVDISYLKDGQSCEIWWHDSGITSTHTHTWSVRASATNASYVSVMTVVISTSNTGAYCKITNIGGFFYGLVVNDDNTTGVSMNS